VICGLGGLDPPVGLLGVTFDGNGDDEVSETATSISDEIGFCWHQFADGVEPKPFGFEFSGEGVLNIGDGDVAKAVGLEDGLHLRRVSLSMLVNVVIVGPSGGGRGAWHPRTTPTKDRCYPLAEGRVGSYDYVVLSLVWRPVCLPVIVSPAWVIYGPEP